VPIGGPAGERHRTGGVGSRLAAGLRDHTRRAAVQSHGTRLDLLVRSRSQTGPREAEDHGIAGTEFSYGIDAQPTDAVAGRGARLGWAFAVVPALERPAPLHVVRRCCARLHVADGNQQSRASEQKFGVPARPLGSPLLPELASGVGALGKQLTPLGVLKADDRGLVPFAADAEDGESEEQGSPWSDSNHV
jgi:hypothetical protein